MNLCILVIQEKEFDHSVHEFGSWNMTGVLIVLCQNNPTSHVFYVTNLCHVCLQITLTNKAHIPKLVIKTTNLELILISEETKSVKPKEDIRVPISASQHPRGPVPVPIREASWLGLEEIGVSKF